ncbi:PD-(D/E)XK nuclease family protein [Leptolyngbya sp. AN03gr2]|uniref:PD-(D/E)XK nuclease family protein n=1 Tax=Leptolyngbya sp. AN03gr2 TaxID=3423364 RepID=UPI003D31986F
MSTVSFSRLESYRTCSQKFYYKYIQGESRPEPIKDYFIKGDLAHFMLEEILTGAEWAEALTLVLPTWLENNCRVTIDPDADLMRKGQALHAESVGRYAEMVSEILLRCAPNYVGEDPIRNQDGSVPADPLGYPPKIVKQILNEYGLNEDRQLIDTTATRLNKEFTPYSLANIAAEAVFCARNYSPPDYFGHTVSIEYPIYPEDHLPVAFQDDKMWSGYIDWIFEMDDGSLVIADHKTSKKRPSGVEVLWHPQLNLYVGLYYELTGRAAEYIAINHLATNSLVLAKVDLAIVGEQMKIFHQLQDAINQSAFVRQFPTGFNSPCLDRDYKTGNVKSLCPYLDRCWPFFLEDIQDELQK